MIKDRGCTQFSFLHPTSYGSYCNIRNCWRHIGCTRVMFDTLFLFPPFLSPFLSVSLMWCVSLLSPSLSLCLPLPPFSPIWNENNASEIICLLSGQLENNSLWLYHSTLIFWIHLTCSAFNCQLLVLSCLVASLLAEDWLMVHVHVCQWKSKYLWMSASVGEGSEARTTWEHIFASFAHSDSGIGIN